MYNYLSSACCLYRTFGLRRQETHPALSSLFISTNPSHAMDNELKLNMWKMLVTGLLSSRETAGLPHVLLYEPHSRSAVLFSKVPSLLKTNQSQKKRSPGGINLSGYVLRDHCAKTRTQEIKGLGIISFFTPSLIIPLCESILQE